MKKILITLLSIISISLSAATFEEIKSEYNANKAAGIDAFRNADVLAKKYPSEAKAFYNEVKDLPVNLYDRGNDQAAKSIWQGMTASEKEDLFIKSQLAIRYVVHNSLYEECLVFSVNATAINVAKLKGRDWYDNLKANNFKIDGHLIWPSAATNLQLFFGDYDYLLAHYLDKAPKMHIITACIKSTNYANSLAILKDLKQKLLNEGKENDPIYSKATAAQKFITNEMLLNKFSK